MTYIGSEVHPIWVIHSCNTTALGVVAGLAKKTQPAHCCAITNLQELSSAFDTTGPGAVVIDLCEEIGRSALDARWKKKWQHLYNVPKVVLVARPESDGFPEFLGNCTAVQVLDKNFLRLLLTVLVESDTEETSITHLAGALGVLRRVQSDVFGLITHDVRGALTVLLSNLSFLETCGDNEDRGELIMRSQDAAQRIRAIISNAELYVNSEHDVHPGGSVDLGALFERMRDELIAVAQSRQLHLDIHLPLSVRVAGSASEMHVLVLNLLLNAMENAPLESNVIIRGYQVDDKVVVTAEDEGIAVKDWHREFVFHSEKLMALKKDGVRIGRGVALPTIRAIAERHGGRAYLQPGVASGLKVVVELKRASQVGSRSVDMMGNAKDAGTMA